MKKVSSTVSSVSAFVCLFVLRGCGRGCVLGPRVIVLVVTLAHEFLLQVIMSLYPGITGKCLFLYAGLDFLIQDEYVFV